jgi:hypothetical protein
MSGINNVNSLNYQPLQHISRVASPSSAPATSAGNSATKAGASSGNTGFPTTNFRNQLASAINKLGSLPSKHSAAGHRKGHRPVHGKKGASTSPFGIG